ncbi:DNA primase family protein [Ensifer soli]|uniref:DNA primase family protein n=1 Tax=Ciceribacter sp. sgz301302 TaxID=3342379 RepID=UPI0035B89497
MTDEDRLALGLDFAGDHQSWSLQEIMDYIDAEFACHLDARSKGRRDAIEIALRQLARANPPFSAIEENDVLGHIAGASGATKTVAALRRDLAARRRGQVKGETHTDIATACLDQLQAYGDIRFDAGLFWQWNGAAWSKVDEQHLLKVIAQSFGSYPAGKRQGDHAGILRVMQSISSAPLSTSSVKGVNFANGFLTEHLDLVAHAAEYGMTYTLPYRYLPEAAEHMPMFIPFLSASWGDDPDYGEKLLALQEMIGVSLMGKATDYQQAFLLYGQAGSGKSVLQAIIRGLLPEGSMSSIVPSDWNDKFLPAQLFGKVINFAGELSETNKIPGGIFKKVVAGEEITAQHKNRDPFEFRPTAAHWFNSNHLPKTRDSSEGFNRRWMILEFNRAVRPQDRVVNLEEQILAQEREAIAAWAIEGYQRLVEQSRFTLPASHETLVTEMFADNNSVEHFLTMPGSKLKYGADECVSLTELHTAYWQFMLASGAGRRVELSTFARMMKAASSSRPFKVGTGKDGQTVYNGLGV